MKLIKRILDWFTFILTGKGPIADEVIERGLIDYSGQGHDKYGKWGTNENIWNIRYKRKRTMYVVQINLN